MRSEARTVEEYLAGLSEDRRDALTAVRRTLLDHLADGFEETMNWGMICYEVPLARYPDTYNGQPLMYAALASQKNHMAVYLSGIYTSERRRKQFDAAYRKAGKRLDAGKSCVRFRKLEDLPLPLIGDTIALMDVDEFVAVYEKARASARRRRKGARSK